jgi:aminopeptidase
MEDRRWSELAEILVGWSTEVRPGQRVLVSMTEPESYPLACAVNAAVVRAGALPQFELQSAVLERDLLALGSDEQAGWVPEMQRAGMEWADVSIGLRGAGGADLTGVSAARIAARRRALGQVSALRTRRTRWVVVRVPGPALAAAAGMSTEAFAAMFFDASLRDWAAESAAYRAAAARFAGSREVRLVGSGTDLTLSVAGRTWVVEDGRVNMPGGEIFTCPVEDAVNGEIAFEQPAIFAGTAISGIRLRVEAGRVIEARADRHQDLLLSLLDIDAGARTVGEFGIGLNAAVDRFCGDLFYDEKIAGTAHIALGRSYAEAGGRNESALHWDIVKDLRAQGAIYADGRRVFHAGRFVDS